MAAPDKTAKYLKMDEKNHVEEPFLQQLEQMQGSHWKVIRLDTHQQESDTGRTTFTDVVMLPDLLTAIRKINPWLEEDQVQEVALKIVNLPNDNLIQNNALVLQMMLQGSSVSVNRKTGEPNPTVRFIDFKTLLNNSFVAVSQFKIRLLGTEHHIYPDIICFVNGLPVVVIECKSPKAKEPIPEAIDQLMRYSEQRGFEKEGHEKLFYYNQFIVSTCRTIAKFGTITTQIEKLFYRWTDPYPFKLDDLEHEGTAPNDQQRLVQGMLFHENLLSIIQSFSLFSTDSKGKIIRIVGRYQQFRAVKLTIQRLLNGKNKKERGGIIWHTQGSGKSLTMVFLIREMYLFPKLQSYKVVLLTDRKQLDDQLRTTAQSVGYTVQDPANITKLKAELSTTSANIVSALIHKFREGDLTEVFPILNTSENILVLTDEAHRSQYSLLGANLDQGLPNATRIAFTGTPIERTEQTFGNYIDKYTMRQSIEDGVTLEIVYEGRTHTASVKDTAGMDTKFEDVFSEYNISERLQILGYGTREAYLEAEETINTKAEDMLRHYIAQVFPNGFKAQIVSCSKEAAHRYKIAVDASLKKIIAELELNNPNGINLEQLMKLKAEVILSAGHNDQPHIKEYANEAKQKKYLDSFKLPFDKTVDGTTGDVGILIVVEMLLTGFDAPVEQVMYLDRIILAHNLLQAIARVNRVGGELKDKGFVVDYVGIGNNLKLALDAYTEKEQQEIIGTLVDETQLFKDLEAAHKNLWSIFEERGIKDLADLDMFYDLFYDEDIRFKFIDAFRKFVKAIDLVFPRKEALFFIKDYLLFSEINVLAGQHLRDGRMSMKGIPDKLRSITDEFLQSEGVEQKVEPISIMDDKFLEHVKARKTQKTKAAEVEHAIRHFIEININEDPELYASFAEAMLQILQNFKDNWDEIYRQLEELRKKIFNAEKEPTYGLHRKKQMPFFRIFKKEFFADKQLNDDEISLLVSLTKEIFERVRLEIEQVGCWGNIPSQNRLKADIIKVLLQEDFKQLPDAFAKRNHIATRIMELAKTNNDIILYAQ